MEQMKKMNKTKFPSFSGIFLRGEKFYIEAGFDIVIEYRNS